MNVLEQWQAWVMCVRLMIHADLVHNRLKCLPNEIFLVHLICTNDKVCVALVAGLFPLPSSSSTRHGLAEQPVDSC